MDGYWLMVVIVAVMVVIRIMLDFHEKKWVCRIPPKAPEKNYTYTFEFVESPNMVLHLFEKNPTRETGKEFLIASMNTLLHLLLEIKKGNKVALMNEHRDIIGEIPIPLSEKVLAMARERREEVPQELKDILKNLEVTIG